MQVSPRLMALPLSKMARKLTVALIAVMGASTIMWSVAQSQADPVVTASSLTMGGQVVAPATSPTINSTFSISGDDQVKWVTYLQPRTPSPFEAIGTSTFLENNEASSNFKWVKGKNPDGKDKFLLPPKTSFEWFVNGSGWTTTEPPTGTIVTNVKWKMEPMVKVDFGVVSTTYDFSGTGDGFRIIPFGKNLYVLNHHTNSQYFNCRVAATGAPCPGFPSNGTGLGLARFAGQAANTADRTYYMVHNPMEAINYETGELFVAGQRGNELDVVCINLNSLVSCGSLTLGTYTTGNWGGNHAPLEQIGDKYFVLAANGDLHCVNIKTKVSCGKTNYNISGTSYPNIGAFTVSSKFGPKGDDLKKMFFAIAGKVFCHDTELGGSCAGWSTAGNLSQFGGVMPILNNDKEGTPKGICDGFGTNCYTIAGASFQTSAEAQTYFMNNSFAPRTYWNGGSYNVRNSYHYSWNAGAIIGTRIITGQSNGYGVSCFDFQKNAVCPGYPKRTDLQTKGYTTNMDPTRANCVLHLGDAARALLFDADTGGACKDGSEAEKPKTIDIDPAQYYRCDATQATVTAWDKVRISPSLKWGGAGGLKSVKVTLQDANGVALPALYKPVRYFDENTYELRIGTTADGVSDLDTVPYSLYPRLRVIVQLTGNGGLTATEEVGMDVTWKGDPIQLCFETKAPKDPGCPTSVDTKVTLAKFENADNAFDETVTGIKSLWPGVPNTGYAAVSAATSPRSILTDTVAGKEGRTRILQGRYDMQNYTGDLWAFDLDAAGNVNAASKQVVSDVLSPSLGRPVFSARQSSGRAGSMAPYQLMLASASAEQQRALNTSFKGVLDNRGNDRVNYHFGFDGPFRARSVKLGPVVNSGPVVLNRNTMPSLPENLFKDYTLYRKNTIDKQLAPLALWGGNDGALHAFTFEKGKGSLVESWTFVPDVMLRQTNRLTDSTLAEALIPHYYVDAIPMIGHADLNGSTVDGWAPVAVMTYGRGARAITALDISNADLSKGKGVLFEYTNATLGDPARSEGLNDLADLGRIVSQPAYDETLGSQQIVRVKDGSDKRWAVIVGNGIKSEDADNGGPSGTGRPVLYAFYLDEPRATAPRWRRIDVQTVTGITNEAGLTTANGLSTPRLVDTDGNGDVDVAYAGDINGNLWRFDLSDLAEAGKKDSRSVTRLFETVGKQPIYTVPVAVRNTVQGACAADKIKQCWQVTFGTGHYFSPINLDLPKNVLNQYLYGLLDKGDKTSVDVTNLVLNKFETPAQRPASGIDFRTVSTEKIDYASGKKRGWYMALGATEHLVGATKLQPTGLAMYPVVQPGKKSTSSASCAPAQSWLIELDPSTGAPAGYTFDINGDGKIDSTDVFPDGGKIPAAMAISGNQFGPPAILLDSSTGSNSMSLVMPSVGQDTSAPNSFGATKGGKPDNVKHAHPKQLGRMSWREVY